MTSVADVLCYWWKDITRKSTKSKNRSVLAGIQSVLVVFIVFAEKETQLDHLTVEIYSVIFKIRTCEAVLKILFSEKPEV